MTLAARNAALLAWYARRRRPLPWRETTRPWPVLVSEVMLQQTQASRVEPAYRSFLERFPDPPSLAAAPLAEALALWSGLGYNRRLVNLRAAAGIVAAGGWPRTAAGLRRLPGVGPYTAAAVACFAFGEPVAAVDTNLRRVLSRWAGSALTGPEAAAAAAGAIDRDRAADWNQAMMDLGATVCLPAPRCGECPVTDWCADPGVYRPPARQPRFEGSRRQARGAAVRALLDGPATLERLTAVTGITEERLAEALGHLEAEGTVETSAGRHSLAG